jgi:Flp pilus assembly protein TadD
MPADAPPPSDHASPRAAFERLLASGKDGALLRYSLGNECLKAGEHGLAIEHLTRATALDARYTAAWKLLGKALQAAGRDADALDAYRRGIEVARVRGDKQAEKEMVVFARRIEKARGI